jgi:hypothetical protein
MSTTRVNTQLRVEAERFNLRFGCEHCAHFAPEARGCGNGYPTAPHLGIDLVRAETFEFCKGFELS